MVATPDGNSAFVSTDAKPTSPQQRGQLRRRAEARDRIGQVAVGRAVAAHHPAEQRQHVRVVDAVEEPARLLGAQELEQHDAPARTHHAPQLAQAPAADRTGCGCRTPKTRRRTRRRDRAGGGRRPRGDRCARLPAVQLVPARDQHLAREVRRRDARARHAARDLQRAVQRPRAQVEEARRLAQPVDQPRDRLLAPDDVDARRHHAVRGVVARRDAVEHAADVGADPRQARAHSPSSLSRAAARASTAGSIFRTSGHSRVKPSSFHLRVASTPSLPPKPNAADA